MKKYTQYQAIIDVTSQLAKYVIEEVALMAVFFVPLYLISLI